MNTKRFNECKEKLKKADYKDKFKALKKLDFPLDECGTNTKLNKFIDSFMDLNDVVDLGIELNMVFLKNGR